MAINYKPTDEQIKVPRFEEAAGFYTTRQRSRTMAKIKGKNTKPEILLRKALWAAGFRYRLHSKDLPGRPDISSKKYKLAIFVDGEFWHGKDWHLKRDSIKSNRAFWIPKIERNRQRDREVNAELEAMGYTVFRFWSIDVKKNLGRCVKEILDYVDGFIP